MAVPARPPSNEASRERLGEQPAALLPGAVIGVLGGGQLGRMLALAAQRMGYRVHVLDPEPGCPASQVAERHLCAPFHDLGAALELARTCDVVTFEFENVPAEVLAALEAQVLVRPSARALSICRNRAEEKRFLAELGLPLAPFRCVRDVDQARAACEALGLPVILKTAEQGYDGKGQRRIEALDEVPEAWVALGQLPAVVEAFVRFDAELSLVAARSAAGEFRAFPLFANTHARHVLDVSRAPADVAPVLEGRARQLAERVAEALDLVGVLCVELFLVQGELWINELAPRVHNSGHGTIEAAATDQFEQHLRAILGLPLGETRLLGACAMANLLGDLWQRGEPDWNAALAIPGVRLHLYGKRDPRAGRKMGHLTALGPSPSAAEAAVRRARTALSEGAPRA